MKIANCKLQIVNCRRGNARDRAQFAARRRVPAAAKRLERDAVPATDRQPRDRSRGAFHRIPKSPNPQIPKSPLAAFTLIEMLIVISIILILVTLTATMFRPDVDGRRVREAARGINVYLASARNRAMETGRPCGVIFRRFGATAAAMTAEQCEVPPTFCGEFENSVARVMGEEISNIDYIVFQIFDGATAADLTPNMVRPGDLIQFNSQGPMYEILGEDGTLPDNNVDDNTGFLSILANTNIYALPSNIGQNHLVPWAEGVWSQPVPYRIFRAPIKGFAQPLQLPAAVVVDLAASGVGTAFAGGADFTVLFSPNGSVECVYVGAVRHNLTGTVYLLVGKNERTVNGFTPGNTNVETLTNYQDLGNRWVTVNPQTGAVQTEPVAAINPAIVSALMAQGMEEEPATIIASRALAVEGIGTGGN